MGKISDVNKLTFNSQHQPCYEGKKIGKWWGKTLYYFNPKDQQLYYHNFSLIGLIFHRCCYKKQFTENGLKNWLVSNHRIDVSDKPNMASPHKKLEFMRASLQYQQSPETLLQFFKDGMDVNTILDNVGTSVLQEVCNRGHFEVAKYLINNGADVNNRTEDGCGLVARTPLQHSIQLGYDKLTLFLLENGADVNSKNGYGEPILHQVIDQLNQKNNAYYKDKAEESNPKIIIQAILAKGANVNARDSKGISSFHKAVQKGDLEVVKWIVNAEVDIEKTEIADALERLQNNKKQQFTEMLNQPQISSEEIIQLFKNGMDVNTIIDDVNTSVLHKACIVGRFEVAKYLIDNGANVNTRTEDGCGYISRTPLQHTITNGHDQLTLYLLEKGADVNTKNGSGEPLLHMAIHQVNRKNNSVTVDKKEEPNPKKIIQAILSKNYDIFETDPDDNTGLHEAVLKRDLEVVKMIVEARANRGIGYMVKRAAELAQENKSDDIANYLFNWLHKYIGR